MKKFTITIGLYLAMLSVQAQSSQAPASPADTSQYKARKLKLDEINLVSSYYQQNGNNSAVTGGIGTEHLTDFANTIDLRVSKLTKKGKKHSFAFDIGIDNYTSASSDKIDPLTVSSASMSDTRIYPSIDWKVYNEEKRTTFGLTGSYSHEYDYVSKGAALNFSKTTKDGNREYSVKLSAFLDQWKVILPAELRPPGYGSGSEEDRFPVDYKPRNSYGATFSVAQVINKRLQLLLTAEPAYQTGLLSTQFHRVYVNTGNVELEKLPDSRLKLPLSVRANYFLGDRTIIRAFYRYYIDDWGMQAHTINVETPVKITPFVSLSPYYRFNTQQAIRYFAPYRQNSPQSEFRTSDYDLSTLTSHFFGMGIRLAPPKGIFGNSHWSALEIRYGHYVRSTGLESDIVTLSTKFK